MVNFVNGGTWSFLSIEYDIKPAKQVDGGVLGDVAQQ